MNLPADIVFILDDERFDSQIQEFSKLQAYELLNAAGRAGRAGHVAQGLVIVLPHALVDFNPQERKISRGWTELQALFSSDDHASLLKIRSDISSTKSKLQPVSKSLTFAIFSVGYRGARTLHSNFSSQLSVHGVLDRPRKLTNSKH